MCKIILALVLAITATKEYVDRRDRETTTNLTAIVTAATNTLNVAIGELETGKQDAIEDLETIRTGAALGATALQNYTETDPTVPSWAKADTKPSYTLNDVAPNSENWLGVQGNAGRTIKILAQGAGSSPAGGVQVTASTLSNSNTTTYAYSGVAVKRNGVNTDYLWDTTSASGIVRRSELAPFITSETDPTIHSWAKASTKPDYAYSEISGTPDLGVYATTGQVAQALSGKLGNTGNQNLDGNLSFWNGQLKFEFWDAMLMPVMTVMGYNIFIPTGKTGTLALTSDIPSVAGLAPLASPAFTGTPTAPDIGTNTTSQVATKKYVDNKVASAAGGGVTAVSVADGGTFGTGDLADGKVEMWRVTCAGAYTPSSAWHLIGYAAWPAAGSTFQCTVWRIGNAYYCNIIVVE